MDMVNAERTKVRVQPLKFMPELKPIADIRAKEAHDWYQLYTFSGKKAPQNQPNPRYRNGSLFFLYLDQNKDIYQNTKFYSLFKSDQDYKRALQFIAPSFGENLVYGNLNNIKSFTQSLINSKGHY